MKAVFKILLLLSCIVGCDSTFNPDGPYKEKMVVYAVFSSRSDTQFVRVYTTSPSRNPSTSTGISDARVMITQGDSVYQFRDSTLSPTRLKAYVAYRLHLTPGFRYGLSVTSPARGSVSSQATALYRGTMLTETNTSGNIIVRVFPGVNARAHIVRMYLEYESRNDSVWVPGRIEIPSYVTATGEFIYPKPISREYTRFAFGASGYAIVVSHLHQRYPGGMVRLKGIRFVLTQLDDWLYAYYSTANGFPDTGTLRLDEPDYTNIDGGLGVFAMSSETILVADTSGH